MNNLNFYIKKIIKIFINFIAYLMKNNFIKNNIIILQSYNDNRYCDNTRYLFEYLSNKKEFNVYWTTDNKEIQTYLKKNKFKFISLSSNFLLYLYVYSNAKIIINPGSNYLDPFNLISSNTLKITTSHGVGPKLTITPTKEIYNSSNEIAEINKFDFINLTAEFISTESGLKKFKILKEKIVNLGFPRCDQFFNKFLVNERYNNKKIFRSLIKNSFNKKTKIIYYTPTWRPYEYTFPLNEMEGFNYHKFDNFLIKNNIFFFYTLHSERNLNDIPLNLNNIKLIDVNRTPLFDTNSFMNETDILINDYSTSSTDYCLLSKPQIFFMPDYDYYNKVKGFLEDYKKIIPGQEIKNYNEFITLIKIYLNQPELYKKKFISKIDKYLIKYYDISKNNSLELFDQFLKNLLDCKKNKKGK